MQPEDDHVTPPDDESSAAWTAPRPTYGVLPRFVIVGRPNVGKSTLFNALAGQRISIEDPMAGVTRDRVSFVLEEDGRAIELIDTGGIGLVDEVLLKDEVERQIAIALDLADLVLFVLDAKVGLTPQDRQIAGRLRRLGRPVRVIVNKVEGRADELVTGEAWSLGFGAPVPISAKERLGVLDLRDELLTGGVAADSEPSVRMRVGSAAADPSGDGEPADDDAPDPRDRDPSIGVRLAIVGRPNAGKSTLVNTLVGEPRVIVSEMPGTTRDSVDVPFSRGGRDFVAIDTAGIRKRATISDSVEFFGQARAEQAIRRADVALFLLDATREIERIDRQIGGLITERALPCILVVNKWDLAVSQATIPEFEEYLRQNLRHLAHAPISFLSATEGLNIDATLALAAELHDQAGQRVTTGVLNRVVQQALQVRRPKPYRGKIGRVYYASQVGTHPPRIVLFVNEPELFEDGWRRFLEHRLQEALPFPDVPVRLFFERSAGSRT